MGLHTEPARLNHDQDLQSHLKQINTLAPKWYPVASFEVTGPAEHQSTRTGVRSAAAGKVSGCPRSRAARRGDCPERRARRAEDPPSSLQPGAHETLHELPLEDDETQE